MVRVLIEADAEVDAKSMYEETPLHIAVHKGGHITHAFVLNDIHLHSSSFQAL